MLRRNSSVDIVRVQDAGLSGAVDPIVLEWTAQEGRVLLTHDASKITRYAYERSNAGQAMPGVFEVSRQLPIAGVIEDIFILAECSIEGESEGQVRYLPL